MDRRKKNQYQYANDFDDPRKINYGNLYNFTYKKWVEDFPFPNLLLEDVEKIIDWAKRMPRRAI